MGRSWYQARFQLVIEMASNLATFRQEIRSWLENEVPVSLRAGTPRGYAGNLGGRNPVFADDDHRRWLELAIEKGLTAPTWPREYGGGGYTSAEAKIVDEEMRRLNLPLPLIGTGLAMIGPALLECGTEAQKLEHLPRIARGEIRWCQGYSEPSAGSDLASLRTRAIVDGTHLVVNGQKVWTSYADKSDFVFALVRTNPDVPKHDGISFLLIDLASPGVAVRPILLISGESPFCETFFDDVRVPVANVVGGIDKGWSVAKVLLGYERKAVSESMTSRSLLGGAPARSAIRRGGASQLGEMAKEYVGSAGSAVKDARIRDEIAQVEMTARGLALATQFFAQSEKAGRAPGPEGSALKLAGTELNQRRQALRMQILGPSGLGWSGEGFSEEDLTVPRNWLRSRANSIEGGTSEIQLNIVAKRILNL